MREDNEPKLEELRAALVAGEESGFTDYSYSSLITELDAQAHEKPNTHQVVGEPNRPSFFNALSNAA